MVDAIVSTAIEKLSDFLTQEINIRVGVKDSVQWLKDELVYLQSSARYAESRQHEDLIRIWINNVNEVARDAVIILEKFSDHQKKHAAPRQGVLDCLRSSICICTKEVELYDIGKEIESVKGRVNEIKNRRAEYGIGNILDTANVQQRKRALLRATAVENMVDVVGFKDDVRSLLAELTREDPALKYVSIHGMGGLGKTTLASKLYYSSELSHFKSRAWVCVSEDYNTEDVLRKIIKSFMKHKVEGELVYLDKMDEADLLQHLLNLLQERDGFLAVIDDIWDIKVWKKIKSAFPDKRDGSGVIITTRYKKVAERVDDRCVVHKLRFLNEDESWQLFCKTAKQTPNLDKLGREMVGRCRGLPLAIVALGGLLFHKKSYQDWSKVKNDLWRQLKGESAEIDEILSLSYNDLSPQMRDCFLYLARFPEDYIFGVEKLKLLWIAEEFITDKGDGLVMEDVAEEYVNELINRNMILIATFQFDGQVAKCRVHDVVRDLAIQKASADKFLGVFDSTKKHPNSIRGQRRQAIYNGTSDYLEQHGSCSADLKVCSLSVMNSDEFTIEEMKLIYSRFENLIVLDLASIKYSERIPENIGDLVRLKFLGLMGGGFVGEPVAIPASISKLKKLQTLWGRNFTRFKFPGEICELEDLRHIRFNGGGFKIQSNQTKLQTVCTIHYSDWIQIDTVNLLDLRVLSITSVKGEEVSGGETAYSLESIARLTSLETFSLDFSHYPMIPSIRPLSYCENLQSVCLSGLIKDPSELRFLPESVTKLSLSETKFTEDPMPTLASLSNLTALDLGEGTYTGEKMVCSDNTFPCLQFLKVIGQPNLKEWHVEDGAMPCLKGLFIDDCDNLMIPERLNCFPPTPDSTERFIIKKKESLGRQIEELRARFQVISARAEKNRNELK